MLQTAKRFVPQTVKLAVKRFINYWRLRSCVRELLDTHTPSNDLLARTSRAWGNESWSADVSYLKAVCEAASTTPGPALECGSGLTTLLLSIYAGRRNVRVVSLEHHDEWRQRIQRTLRRFRLSGNVVCAPLRSYGDFDWYTLPQVPDEISLVVCDGPPASTRGGRVGLIPVCLSSMRSGCVILMDDAERSGEQEAIEKWRKLGASVTITPCRDGSFARLVV